MSMMTRRRFLSLAGLALPATLAADVCTEATSLRISQLKLNPDGKLRFVHFTDFHYKGDDTYAQQVVRRINELAPDFVAFTGDLVEDRRFAPAALDYIRAIKAPVYGSPGNHDYNSRVAFSDFARVFGETGGEWLVDRSALLPNHDLEIVGMALGGIHAIRPPRAGRRLLLNHYPALCDAITGHRFDLMLAGHSHGGQVRLPFYGAPVLPWGVGRYDLGYFETKAGPLYVNAGIGTYYFPFRFNCRPELTLITL
ncbi:MAG: metallophosphoesterase [Chthoniobacterales bacterium]